MPILVVYASRHGSTQGIAERIAAALRSKGLDVDLRPVNALRDLAAYDAFVVGGAAYMGSWMKDATEFVRRNQAILATKPVWLFSSGPLGSAKEDAQGRDVLAASEPKEFAELQEAVRPLDAKVFFGALAPSRLGVCERLLRILPAGRRLLPEGDFRDWNAIEAWADSIARELAPVAAR